MPQTGPSAPLSVPPPGSANAPTRAAPQAPRAGREPLATCLGWKLPLRSQLGMGMTYRSSCVRVCEAASLSSARCSSLWHDPCACGRGGLSRQRGGCMPPPQHPRTPTLRAASQAPASNRPPALQHGPGVLSTHPALPSPRRPGTRCRPPRHRAALTMGLVSSRWDGLPLLRILLPWLTRFACCFCRHLRSWMLQGLKLLLGWSISSFSARTRSGGGSAPRGSPGHGRAPTEQPAPPSATCCQTPHLPSPVPAGVTPSPGSPGPLPPLPPRWAQLSPQPCEGSRDLSPGACRDPQPRRHASAIAGSGGGGSGARVWLCPGQPRPTRHRALAHGTGPTVGAGR